MTPAITAWAIKASDGELCLSTIRDNEVSAKYAARNICNMDNNEFSWGYIEREGYRCVRVRVEEIENPKDKTCNLSDCEVADKSSKKCKKCMAAGRSE